MATRILAGAAGTRFRSVEVHAELTSTQDRVRTGEARDGRVVVADHQTLGRGRVGRRWESLPGRGLLFSVLLAGIPPENAPLVSLAAGVAVARALEGSGGLKTALKWPNDVRVCGRKVCGILGELTPDGRQVALGIGVNVHHGPGELSEELNATSLRLQVGRELRRDDVLVAILRELDALIGTGGWLEEYRRRCETLGSRVRVQTSSGPVEGTASEVRDDGALVVGGRAVTSGDVVGPAAEDSGAGRRTNP